MKAKNDPVKRLFFNALGLTVSILPVVLTVLSYFPLWIAREDASVLSGLALVLVCLALVPLYRYIRVALRSPSAPLLWLIAFIIFLLLSRIAEEMTVICLVGFVTNLIGSLLFRIGKRYDKRGDANEGCA